MKLKPNKDHISYYEDEEFARLLVTYYKFYQSNYYEWEHDHYRRSSYRPVACDRIWFNRFTHYGGHRIKWQLLEQMYDEGFRVLKKLKCSYFEFCDFMIYGVPNYYYKLIAPPNDLRKGYWFWGWGYTRKNDFMANHRRCKQKYQKKSHHKKKVKTEKQKQREEWRKKKGIDKDSRKPNYVRRGPGKYYKAKAAREHRRWAKQELQKGNWEPYFDSSSNWETEDEKTWDYNYPENDWDNQIVEKTKWFADPWEWD